MNEVTNESTGPVVDATKAFTAAQAQRLRVNRVRVLRIAWQLKRDGTLAETKKERAEQIAAIIVNEEPEKFEACRVEDGRDWESFFAALISFIEKIMPLLMLFL